MTSPNSISKQHLSVYLILAVGILAVAFASIFIRYAQNEQIPSIVIAASRLLIAAILLTPLTITRHTQEIRHLTPNNWLFLIGSSIFLALHFAFWITSLEYTSVLISVTLVTTTPIWTALLEWVILKSVPQKPLIIGMVIAIIGGLFIGFENTTSSTLPPSGNRILLGAIFALMGSISIAAYLTIGRSIRTKISLLPYIWIVYGISGLALTLIMLAQGLSFWGYSQNAYLWLFALGTIPQLIGHSALNYAVKYISATYVSVTTKLEPIGSAIVAYFTFHEIPSLWQIIGSIAIIIGVTIATLNPQKPKSS